MTAAEVIELIKAAQSSGIIDFRLGELQFKFGVDHAAPAVQLAVEDPRITQENLERNELEVKDVALENLRLADPLAYEQMIVEDQLERE